MDDNMDDYMGKNTNMNILNDMSNHIEDNMNADMLNNMSNSMEENVENNMLPYMMDGIDDCMEDDEYIEMFSSFRGIVKDIRHFFDEDNNIVENHYFMDVADGDILVTFYLTPETYYADCKIRAGEEVIGFYKTNQPMILIYPPRYTIRVLARVKEGRNVKADFFNQNLISSDRTLKLNISDETYIINEQGRPFCRDITGRDLFVIYGASTRSVPAITTPSVVVVLS